MFPINGLLPVGYTLGQWSQLPADRFEVQFSGTAFGNNRITGMRLQRGITGPEKFPYQPFDPIANHGVPYFATDRHAKPTGPAILMLFDKNKKMGRMYLAPHLLTLQEILPIFKSVCGGKYLPARCHLQLRLFARNGCRQVLATLGTTATNNRLSVLALHPLAETVGSLATDTTRLIGAFHSYLHLLYGFLHLFSLRGKGYFYPQINRPVKSLSATVSWIVWPDLEDPL